MDPNRVETASPAVSNEELPKTDAAPAAEGAPATTDANPAESSPADTTDANQKPDLLSVVRDAVKLEPAAEASSTPEEEQAKAAAEAEPAKAEEPKAGDDADVPFHNHPRWKELLRERDELKPAAEQYGNIIRFMEAHGLVPEEVAQGFEVMASLKSGDPTRLAEALDWFEAQTNFLRDKTGRTLPQDLREKVDTGLLDEESAKELAATRATNALREEQDKQRTETAREVSEADRAREFQSAVMTAVQGWEERKKASDPDYSRKAALIETTTKAMFLDPATRPRDVEGMIALCDAAYAKVNETLSGLVPKPKPIDPDPAGSSAKTTVAPKSLREAVVLAAAGA